MNHFSFLTHIQNAVRPAAAGLLLASGFSFLQPALAETGLKRYPVTEEMVVSAMQGRQLPTTGVQLRLSAPITAVSANPALEIQTISLTGTASAQLKVACHNRGECTPFYVAAAWPAGTEKSTLVAKPVPSDLPASPTHDEEASIHAGSRTTLVIEDARIQIQLRVISLEAGVPGDKIRVTTPDHRQTFTAEILTAGIVKGSF